MEKNIGEYLSRKSTEVIAIVACIGLIITIILAAGQWCGSAPAGG